jgi:2-methylcitrate dehydratase PrpD
VSREREKVLRVGAELVRYIGELSYGDIPKDVVRQAKRTVLDTLGTIYMGARKEEARGLQEFLRKNGERSECTVVGANFKVSCASAAFANSSYSMVHDANDGHRDAAALGGTSHPGCIAIPTALAVGEKSALSGKEALCSIVIGYDVMTRIRGMEKRPPSGAYGAAAIAGRLLKLNHEQLLYAMGIAGYHGPSRFAPEEMGGYAVKFLAAGYQAKAGIEAALLAKEGLTGPPLGDDRRLTQRFTTRGLGKEFEIMNIYVKPYPTCRMTHAAIDATLDLRRRHGIGPSDVEKIVIHQLTHGMYVAKEKIKPDNSFIKAQFDIRYVTACALIDGEIEENQFAKERIADSDIHKLAEKIDVIEDEELDKSYPEARPVMVEITTKSGRTYTSRVDYAKGDPQNPLTDEELFEKFKRWTGPNISNEQKKKISEAVFNLDEAKDLSTLMDLLCSK